MSNSEWMQVKLGDVADIVMGQAPSGDTVSDTGPGILFLQGNAEFGAVNPAARLVCRRPVRTCEAGDLLVSVRAPVGALNVADQPYAIGRGLAAIRFRQLDSAYGRHSMVKSVGQLRRVSQGTTFEAVGRREIADIAIFVPTGHREQRRIAEILDTVDKQIGSTERLVGKLRQIIVGLGEKLLPWNAGDVAPGGWSLYEFEEITVAPICYGIIQVGSFHPGGVPVVMIRDLESDLDHELHLANPRIEANYSRSRVQDGDVIVSVKGTIGRLAVVPGGFVGNISRDVARIRSEKFIRPPFLKWLLSTPAGQDVLNRAVVGTTRAEVSIQVLKRLQVPIPPLPEQDRILAIVSAGEQRLLQEEKQLRALRLLKQGLMEDLLTGRVRVTSVS
jgi:type I restriction enzyme, S subunit